MLVSMLTTIDNPHDPFDDYPAWEAYDLRVGHHTNSYLARIAVTSHEMSEADQNLAVQRAIDTIMEENVNGMYKVVSREVKET